MPVHSGIERGKHYYQWGQHGKKYYYSTFRGQYIAYTKAMIQGRAIHSRMNS